MFRSLAAPWSQAFGSPAYLRRRAHVAFAFTLVACALGHAKPAAADAVRQERLEGVGLTVQLPSDWIEVGALDKLAGEATSSEGLANKGATVLQTLHIPPRGVALLRFGQTPCSHWMAHRDARPAGGTLPATWDPTVRVPTSANGHRGTIACHAMPDGGSLLAVLSSGQGDVLPDHGSLHPFRPVLEAVAAAVPSAAPMPAPPLPPPGRVVTLPLPGITLELPPGWSKKTVSEAGIDRDELVRDFDPDARGLQPKGRTSILVFPQRGETLEDLERNAPRDGFTTNRMPVPGFSRRSSAPTCCRRPAATRKRSSRCTAIR